MNTHYTAEIVGPLTTNHDAMSLQPVMNYISSFSIDSKGAITEVILVFDLGAGEFLHGDAKFSREFCMVMPNSLFGEGYQNH